MSRLENVDGDNWRDFIASPTAVLVLGKSDCEKCGEWSAELAEKLASDAGFGTVRFGKMLLDQRGLTDFKRENPWLAELDVLPYNVIFHEQERVKSFAGGGWDRLANRLRRVVEDDG